MGIYCLLELLLLFIGAMGIPNHGFFSEVLFIGIHTLLKKGSRNKAALPPRPERSER